MMWLVIVGSIVVALVIVAIAKALGFDYPRVSRPPMERSIKDQDELLNRWLHGPVQPGDEERMFEEFYEGDVDDPTWS